ncbi:MAG: DUF58 domain-containing protein [Flavobacteriales bacterium]|jgi:uncharacterized protein (DUF58 family)|nr:DUF58 domain-containing protein [Flavobacteriales bacterium]|tara:strand:+ start:1845 stop:2771 length:927 start_codon:yes stop_codon:yes gene_type:complete
MKNLEYINLPGNMELFAKQVVEGFITGMHKSPYHGFSVEFAEHRLYNTGESIKHIDWKLFGRTDKLFVKRYEEETNLRCQLVIDASSSMYYPNFEAPTLEKPNKLLFAIYASAVMMNLLKRQRDAVGLSVFSDKLDVHTPNRTTQRHNRLLYHELESLLEDDALKNSKQTESNAALHQISELLHKRSLVMVFTDFINSNTSLEKQFEAYKHLKYNKHEVVLFYLAETKTELDLNFDNKPYKFIDVESREEVKLNPNQYKEEYQKQAKNYLKELRLKCLQYKIDLVEVDVNMGFDKVLNSYLLKRQKML